MKSLLNKAGCSMSRILHCPHPVDEGVELMTVYWGNMTRGVARVVGHRPVPTP